MPKGPKGEKRHADTVQNAMLIGRIATGEVEDTGSSLAASELGKKGGAARAAQLGPDERSRIAKEAAAKRWKKPENR